MVILGQSAERVKRAADKAGVPYVDASDIADATRKAYELAEEGDVVLLSPANASWDMYANFEVRGDLFLATVAEFKRIIWKKIVFTGGGTVGACYPQPIIDTQVTIEDGWEVHYIGDKNGIEHHEILKSGLDVTFHSIATGKLRRYFSWQNMVDVFKVAFGILQSLFIMLRVRPQALFSKGWDLYLFRLLSQREYVQ